MGCKGSQVRILSPRPIPNGWSDPRRRGGGLQWQREVEGAALVRHAANADDTAVRLDDASGYVQTQPHALDLAGIGAPSIEALEQLRLLLEWNAHPMVDDLDHHLIAAALGPYSDLTPIGRILYGIADQIVQDLFQAVAIPQADQLAVRDLESQWRTRRHHAEPHRHVVQHAVETHVAAGQFELTASEAGHVQQIVHQAAEANGLGVNVVGKTRS